MIGETRQLTNQAAAAGDSVTVLAGVGPARGVLRSAAGPGHFRHERHAPAPPLCAFVEHYWMVHWDLRGHAPQLRETLPHPSVHLLIEQGHSRIAGVATGRFSRLLEGQGFVFGVKFTPGGFRPFLRKSVSIITDRVRALTDVFAQGSDQLEQELLAQADSADMIDVASRFLCAHLPPVDVDATRVAQIVRATMDDRSITAVGQLVQRFGINKRALQRLFAQYVGVSPKWVINRYRLHEALELLSAGRPADWTALALSLGYFDQSHFIRDFKCLVGKTPTEYSNALSPVTAAGTAASPRPSTP